MVSQPWCRIGLCATGRIDGHFGDAGCSHAISCEGGVRLDDCRWRAERRAPADWVSAKPWLKAPRVIRANLNQAPVAATSSPASAIGTAPALAPASRGRDGRPGPAARRCRPTAGVVPAGRARPARVARRLRAMPRRQARHTSARATTRRGEQPASSAAAVRPAGQQPEQAGALGQRAGHDQRCRARVAPGRDAARGLQDAALAIGESQRRQAGQRRHRPAADRGRQSPSRTAPAPPAPRASSRRCAD